MWVKEKRTHSVRFFLAKERLFVHCHAHNVLYIGFLAFPLGINSIGIGTVETAEVAALQENNKTQTRTVKCS